jgi:hypothetical protein
MGKKDNASDIEITSSQLLGELQEIKDRVGALENVAGIVNQDALEKYFREAIVNEFRRAIMETLRTPKTREELRTQLAHKSRQALDYHLNPLRE